MRWVALALVVAIVPARADRMPCQDLVKEQAKLDAANTKSRDTALAAAGLKVVQATLVARGAQPKQPAGNIVWIKLTIGCDTDPKTLALFAVGKAGKVYRVMPKTTSTEVSVYACGSPSCKAPCGMPPSEETYAFKLPDKLVYSGEKEVAWQTQVARVDYDIPTTCTKHGQAVPVTPAPPGAQPAATKGELEKLRAENAKLRAENARLKADLEKINQKLKEELDRLRDEQRRMSKDLK